MLRRAALASHFLRITVCAIALGLSPWPLVPVTAIALYYAVFMLGHELAHSALGLPRRLNDVALAIVGLAMAASGHALRVMHLHHHARPFTDDDLEGYAASLTPGRALRESGSIYVRLLVAAWQRGSRRARAWHAGEHLAMVAIAVALVATGGGVVAAYLAIAFTLQLLAPFWAGHVVHRPPTWLVAFARPFARMGSELANNLVRHYEHHEQPRLPMQVLGQAGAPTTAGVSKRTTWAPSRSRRSASAAATSSPA